MNVTPEIITALRRIHADLGEVIAGLSADEPHMDELRLGVLSRRIVAQEEMLFMKEEQIENVD